MRLSDVLSKAPTPDPKQIEGFLSGKKLAPGQQRKLQEGIIALNYFCKKCEERRTFCSGDTLYCIGVNDHLVSIDCVLQCPSCESSVQMWFLVDCIGNIWERAPEVRILKRSEKLSDMALLDQERYGGLSSLLEKSQRAYRDGLGAGAMVYLRKVFELVTMQTATAAGISCSSTNGKRKPFKDLLEEVDRHSSIIPREFSADGYKLFSELSDIVHGNADEELALLKYESLHRLIIGILDSIKNNNELMSAIGALGWNDRGQP